MEKIKAYLIGKIIFSNSPEAYSLMEKSSFGEVVNGKIQYSICEAIFLSEKGKLDIFMKNKKINHEDFVDKFQKVDGRMHIKYLVFKDLREKGYIVKTALKFGADFRVYDKGVKPGNKHAKWIVFVDHESKKISWHEFSSKNRIAHSTKKNLLLAIIDEEGDASYYEVKWIKP